MSTLTDTTETEDATQLVDRVRALAPGIAGRVDEIERGRRIPPDLVEQLVVAGCFRMGAPRTHGGTELDLAAQLHVIEELATVDASVAWAVVIGGAAAPPLLAHLPRPSFDAVYADGPDVILASGFNPTGAATPEDDGFWVDGRWAFASGCQHAHWFLAHCVVDDGRQPPLRMMLVPGEVIEIVDTWSVSGLAGTGSHDVVVHDVWVPVDRTFALDGGSCMGGTLNRIPELTASTLAFAAVAVGIATGALDDIVQLATAKVPAFAESVLAANPGFRHDLGEADARLRAARSLLHRDTATAWSTASAHVELPELDRARMRATATWAVREAAAVVDTAYDLGGASSIRSTSPLQRRFRDIHALTQHFALKDDIYAMTGAVLTGQDVDLTFL